MKRFIMSTDKSSITRVKWAAEAEAHGWTWVARVDVANSLYRHSCDHEQVANIGAMRNGNVRCKRCKQSKWKSEAQVFGFNWLSNIDSKHGMYKCKTCGHDQQSRTDQVRIGKVRCVKCRELKTELAENSRHTMLKIKTKKHASANQHREQRWLIDAQINGLTWLSKIDSQQGMYQCNACSSQGQFYMISVRKGEIKCTSCQKQKWLSEAKPEGWTWLLKIDGARSLYSHSCGHEQNFYMSDMRKGQVLCHGCSQAWVNRPSNMYLLRITIDELCFLKLGIARDVGFRASKYGLPGRAKIEIVRTIAYRTNNQARKHEIRIHRTIVSHPAVKRFDASHWMTSGFTECYMWSEEAENTLSHAMFLESTTTK